MKRYILFTLVFSGVITACKKDNTQANLSLLRHKWQIVSLNGEVYRYVGKAGDYFNFGDDNKLVEFAGGNFDTSSYSLTGGGQTLSLHSIHNGIQSGSAFDLQIKVLSSSSLIVHYSTTPPAPVIYILDSLSR